MKVFTLTISLLLCCLASFAQNIGVQLYTFRNEFKKDVKGTIEMIRSFGIKKVEGGGTYGMPHAEYKALLDQNKIKTISVGGDFDQIQKDPKAIVENAKRFGAKYVVTFWIPHTNNEFTVEDADKAIAVFNTAGKYFKENGLSFCYHPHGYEFRPYNNTTLFDYMIEKLDPAYVNFEMDIFWVKHPGQDPVKYLEKYPGRFPLMHLKDRQHGTVGNQNGQADVETNVVLGQGDVNIAAVMKAAKKAGVKHYFIEDESSRSVQQVPLSLAYLKMLK